MKQQLHLPQHSNTYLLSSKRLTLNTPISKPACQLKVQNKTITDTTEEIASFKRPRFSCSLKKIRTKHSHNPGRDPLSLTTFNISIIV